MKHLSVEDMISYTKASVADKSTLDHISRVLAHINECESCRNKLSDFENEIEAENQARINKVLSAEELALIDAEAMRAVSISYENDDTVKDMPL